MSETLDYRAALFLDRVIISCAVLIELRLVKDRKTDRREDIHTVP